MKGIRSIVISTLLTPYDVLARGPASTTDYGGGDGSGFFMLLLIIGFYAFITSNFGMSLLLFSLLTVSIVTPLVFVWLAFQDGSAIEAIAYGSLLASFYWGPLVATMLPDEEKYIKIKEFGYHICTLALIGFFPIMIVSGIISVVFSSEEARAWGVIGSLIFLYYWSTKDHANNEESAS